MDAKFYIKNLNKSSNNNSQQDDSYFPIGDINELSTEEKLDFLKK